MWELVGSIVYYDPCWDTRFIRSFRWSLEGCHAESHGLA